MTSDGGLTWGAIMPAAIRGKTERARGLRRERDRIEYGLASPGRVEVRLLDATRRQSRMLFAGVQAAGNHSLRLRGN